jgi:hypothetical protein
MTRYFFDVKCIESMEYDYRGRVLPSLEHAQQMAELIAMDLGCTRPDVSSNTEVQIRGARWTLLATVPVSAIESLAA